MGERERERMVVVVVVVVVVHRPSSKKNNAWSSCKSVSFVPNTNGFFSIPKRALSKFRV